MKKIIFLLLILLPKAIFAFSINPEQEKDSVDTSNIRISLLTCSQNGDVSSAFGHSALRVKDSKNDIVFNYGTFDFDEPNFVLKFLRGDLDYFLSIGEFDRFIQTYQYYGRGVVEEELNLSHEQKMEIYSKLLINLQPENVKYRYDFMVDNCATRIRDLFNDVGLVLPWENLEMISSKDTLDSTFIKMDDVDLILPAAQKITYRDNLDIYIAEKKWLKFGIDLLLGSPVDKEISTEEEMFLPIKLSSFLGQYYNPQEGLFLITNSIVHSEKVEVNQIWNRTLQPIIVLWSLFFILALLGIFKRNWLVKIAKIYYLIFGLSGVLLFFLWFGTSHIWTEYNWNLLIFNPLYLIAVFFKPGKLRYYYLLLLLFPAISFFAYPQHINLCVIPLIFIMAIFNGLEARQYYSKLLEK